MDELTELVDHDPSEPGWIAWPCATCGEPSQVLWDPEVGDRTELVEDCTVCCRPNLLTILAEPESRMLLIRVRPESP